MAQRPDFIPLARPDVTGEEIEAVSEVLRSGWWTTGPKVTAFEDAVASFLGSGVHCVALNSCTAGLYLALKALNIGPGDEVIVPTWTFAATSHVVEWAGATPVLCDVLPSTLTIDPDQVERLFTPRTRAVMPVHLAGYPCEMEPLREVVEGRDIVIVEDAAHAFGTRYGEKLIGSFGSAAVFSFYATKNLACGEGGMLVTSDRALAEEVRRLSYFGINKEAWQQRGKDSWYYEIAEMGYKFNMDSMHAALGLVQLQKIDRLNARRLELARLYHDNLRGLGFPEYDPRHRHTYHLFMVTLPDGVSRDRTIAGLKAQGIGSSVHYIPLHLHPYFTTRFPAELFPVATAFSDRTLSLPMYPSLSDEEVLYVCKALNAIVECEAC